MTKDLHPELGSGALREALESGLHAALEKYHHFVICPVREAQAWLASMTPRPEIVAVSSTVWGIKWKEQMICAPTIVEAVAVLRDALTPSRQGAAKDSGG